MKKPFFRHLQLSAVCASLALAGMASANAEMFFRIPLDITVLTPTTGGSSGTGSGSSGGGSDTGSSSSQPVLTPTAFSDTRVTASSKAVVRITNPSSKAMTLRGSTVDSTAFTTDMQNCGSTLAAGGECDVLVTFAPTAAEKYLALFSVVVDGATYTTTLTATAFPNATVSSVTSTVAATGAITVNVVGANFPTDTAATVTPAGVAAVSYIDAQHLTVTLTATGSDVLTAYLVFPNGQANLSLGNFDPNADDVWAILSGSLELTNANRTVTQTVRGDANATTARSFGSGKHYLEATFGSQGVLTLNGGGISRYFDGKYNDSGGAMTLTSGANQATARARWGYALDADAKTWTVYDTSTCTAKAVYSYAGNTAAAAYVTFTTRNNYDTVISAATLYITPGSPNCLPAGYSWW